MHLYKRTTVLRIYFQTSLRANLPSIPTRRDMDKKTHGSDLLLHSEAGTRYSKNTCFKILGEDLLRRPHKSTIDIRRESHYSTLSLHRACTSHTQALHHGGNEPSPVALLCFMWPALVAEPHSSNGGNENCWGRQIDVVHLRPRFKPAALLLINRGVLIQYISVSPYQATAEDSGYWFVFSLL